MAQAQRAQVRRDVAARLEAKRQRVLASMSEDDREFFRDYDLGMMIAVRHSSRPSADQQ